MRWGLIALIALTCVLVGVCLFLAYGMVSQSVSLDYARAAQRSLERERDVLRQLTLDLVRGAKRPDVEALVASKYAAGHVIKSEGDVLYVDGVGLRFSGDHLTAIVFMSEPESTPAARR